MLFFEQCLSGVQKEFQFYSVIFIQSVYQMFCLDLFLPRSMADLLQNNSVSSKEALKILTQYFFNVFFFTQDKTQFDSFLNLFCFCVFYNSSLYGRWTRKGQWLYCHFLFTFHNVRLQLWCSKECLLSHLSLVV